MHRALHVLFALLVLTMLAAPAAAGPRSQSTVTVTVDAGALSVTPLVAYDYLSLRVLAPDGQVFQIEGAGGPVAFRPRALAGDAPPDGRYAWEVVLTPGGTIDPERRAGARRDRESGDGERAPVSPRSRGAVVEAGVFHVRDGQILPGDARERRGPGRGRPARGTTWTPFGPVRLAAGDDIVPADQFFDDDLVVDGRGCIGLNCAAGEVFDAETLKLKSTSPNLTFEDVTDDTWDLRVNAPDSRFAIRNVTTDLTPFIILGGAPTGAFFMDDTGRVGLGTTLPQRELVVVNGDTPTVRLDQNGSGGFDPWSWDLEGNETRFTIRNTTNGTYPVMISSAAPTYSINVSSLGRVGFGTSLPEGNIHVYGTALADVFAGIGPSPAAGPALNFGYSGSTYGRGSGFFNSRPDALAVAPNPSLRFATANVQRMIITNLGRVGLGVGNPSHPLHLASGAHVTAGGVWTDASSREAKQDIAPLTLEEARATLARLDPVKYAYRADPGERHVGFIAEDVPDLVAASDRKGLSPMDLVAVLTRVVQEQQARLETHERAAASLERVIAELAAEVAALRRAVPR